MRNKTSGITATSLSTPRRMDGATPNSLGSQFVNAKRRSGRYLERHKEGNDCGRSRVKTKKSFDRKQSSNGASFEKITPNAPIRHRERSGLALSSSSIMNDCCESREATGMSPGQSFSKEIRDPSMREEVSREVAPNSDPSEEEKIPTKSDPAPGEIEVVAMVDKEGRDFTRILVGRKRERLVIKKVAAKKIHDTANESKGTTTKIAPFRRKNSGSDDAKNSQTPLESSIKMNRIIRSLLSRPQRVKRPSSRKNASTTQHVDAIAVALNQESGQCQAKIPPRPTSEEGIEPLVPKFSISKMTPALLTSSSVHLKQENSKNQKSKNHRLSSLSMTRSASRKRSEDASAKGNKGLRFRTSNDLQKKSKKQGDAPREHVGKNIKKDTTVCDIQKETYESAKHIDAEDDEGPHFRMFNDFPQQLPRRQENVPEEKHTTPSIALLGPRAVCVAQPSGTSSAEAMRASMATSSLQDKSTEHKEGFKLAGGFTSSPFGICQPNTLAFKSNATFDMQHQLDGNIAKDRETQKGSSCTRDLGAEETTETTAFIRSHFGVARAEIEGLRGTLSCFLPSPDLGVKEFARTWSSFLAPAPTGAKGIYERTSLKQRNVQDGILGKKSIDDIPSVGTDSYVYDNNVAPSLEESERETKNDLFEDIRTSSDTRDTNEETKDPWGENDVLANSSVVYRPPPTAGTRNVSSAPEMNRFLIWPFGYSGWNPAPNPRPSTKINHKLGAAQRLGLIDDDLAAAVSMMEESNSSSSTSSRESDFDGQKTEAHSSDDFSDTSTDFNDSKRGYECTTHDSFSQVLEDSAYASDEDLKGYEYGSGEWEIVLDLPSDLPSLYNDETGSVNSQALQNFLDAAGNGSSDSVSDSGDRSASDDSVGRVDEAIAKFKLHAFLLGVDEKDLLLAIQKGALE